VYVWMLNGKERVGMEGYSLSKIAVEFQTPSRLVGGGESSSAWIDEGVKDVVNHRL